MFRKNRIDNRSYSKEALHFIRGRQVPSFTLLNTPLESRERSKAIIKSLDFCGIALAVSRALCTGGSVAC